MTEAVSMFRESVSKLVESGVFSLAEIQQQARWAAVNASLQLNKGNQSRVARELGVHRNTVNREVCEMKAKGGLRVALRSRYKAKPVQSVRSHRKVSAA